MRIKRLLEQGADPLLDSESLVRPSRVDLSRWVHDLMTRRWRRSESALRAC